MKPWHQRRKLIIASAGILLAGVAAFALCAIGSGRSPLEAMLAKRPFRELEASQITTATVRLTPPDTTLRILDTETLAGLLRDVETYRRDDSYTEYSGQGVSFALTMADGTQVEVGAYNPFVVIDGAGYRTADKPCEALSSYANRLLQEKEAPIVMTKPPLLDVISDDTCCSAMTGTYSWRCDNGDGTTTGGEADAPHPLDCKDSLTVLETTEGTAKLRFDVEPDELTARCWSDAHWSDTGAESEEVSVRGNEITLKPGTCIYEVFAWWDPEKGGSGGTASYAFCVEVVE